MYFFPVCGFAPYVSPMCVRPLCVPLLVCAFSGMYTFHGCIPPPFHRMYPPYAYFSCKAPIVSISVICILLLHVLIIEESWRSSPYFCEEHWGYVFNYSAVTSVFSMGGTVGGVYFLCKQRWNEISRLHIIITSFSYPFRNLMVNMHDNRKKKHVQLGQGLVFDNEIAHTAWY